MLLARSGSAGAPLPPARSALPGPPPLLGVALGLLLVALGAVYLGGQRSIVLVVDGDARDVVTHAGSVSDLLGRVGLEVGPDDRVEPGLDAPLADGDVVSVSHAREITLIIGEAEQQVLVTALTVDEVVNKLAPALADAPARRTVRPARSERVREGMVVRVSDPVALMVAYDGRTREVITDAPTVGAMLARLGIEVGPTDRVIPGVEHPTEPDILVTVQRVEITHERRTEPLAHITVERPNDELAAGTRRQVRAGAPGTLQIVEEVTRVDGVEESRTRLDERIVTEPTDEIVEVGTRRAAPAAPPAAAAPAPQPESQPAPVNVQEGKASWYDNPAGGRTAAHRSLPRGTVVTVTNLANGKQVQVRINDRGPFIPGRIIDLNRSAFAEIASPGAGVVQVRITW